MPESRPKISRETLAAMFKALSNENRLAIFEQIRNGRSKHRRTDPDVLTSSDIAVDFDLSSSTISHHVKELRRSGLVECERQGQFVRLHPCEDGAQAMIDYLTQSPDQGGG